MVKKIDYHDVEESPAWNGSSLRDGVTVPRQVKGHRKRKTLVAEEEVNHVIETAVQNCDQNGHLGEVFNKQYKGVTVQDLTR